MVMKSTMSREQIESFAVDLRDLHERCAQAYKMQMGSLITLLTNKMPPDLKAEHNQLRTNLSFMNTFNSVTPYYDDMVALISDLEINARLDSQERSTRSSAMHASTTSTERGRPSAWAHSDARMLSSRRRPARCLLIHDVNLKKSQKEMHASTQSPV